MEASRDQPGDSGELSASHDKLGSKMVVRQQLTDLHRQAMHFVQEKKLFRFEIAPFDLLLFREPMFLREQDQEGFLS